MEIKCSHFYLNLQKIMQFQCILQDGFQKIFWPNIFKNKEQTHGFLKFFSPLLVVQYFLL